MGKGPMAFLFSNTFNRRGRGGRRAATRKYKNGIMKCWSTGMLEYLNKGRLGLNFYQEKMSFFLKLLVKG
jgi:hypothetical protein